MADPRQGMLFNDADGQNRNAAPKSSTSSEVKNEGRPRTTGTRAQAAAPYHRGRKPLPRRSGSRKPHRFPKEDYRGFREYTEKLQQEDRENLRREREERVRKGRRRQALGKAYSPKSLKGLANLGKRAAGPAALLYAAYEIGQDVTGTDAKSRAQILRNYLEEEGMRNVYTSKNPLRAGDELARELEFLTNLSLAKQSAGRYSETRMAPGMSQITVDDLLSSGAFG